MVSRLSSWRVAQLSDQPANRLAADWQTSSENAIMHELSIAASIVETVSQEIKWQNLQRVQTIVLRIGALSGVDPEALRFGFEAITTDTPFAKTRLDIEYVPVQGKCRACGRRFTVEDFIFACPICQSVEIEITAGEELDIAYLEIEEGEVENSHKQTAKNVSR